MSDRMGHKLKLGVLGLGRAFQLMLPTFLADPRIVLTAAADPREEARHRFASDFSARAYTFAEEMCADPDVDVVYVATPHQFHAAHVLAAASSGKHVLVEKPMALTIEDCLRMIAAVRQAGVHLIVGHSHSFDAPVRKARDIVASGAFGALRMISAMNYTDFLYRPRRAEELHSESGGGVVFNQAPHHVDIVRLLAGGRIVSVAAAAGGWDRSRPVEAAYGCLLRLEEGAFATLTYSGYGHFDSDELMDWVGESGHRKDPQSYGTARRLLRQAKFPEDELALKTARLFGGTESAGTSLPMQPESAKHRHAHFGVIVASCDGADLRPTPHGVWIYEDDRRRFEELAPPAVPRLAVIDELYDAVVLGRPPLHDGAWGLATMEACLAILQSSREGREIGLKHQTVMA